MPLDIHRPTAVQIFAQISTEKFISLLFLYLSQEMFIFFLFPYVSREIISFAIFDMTTFFSPLFLLITSFDKKFVYYGLVTEICQRSAQNDRFTVE